MSAMDMDLSKPKQESLLPGNHANDIETANARMI